MKKATVIFLISLPLLLLLPGNVMAALITINFDDAAGGTQIDTRYAGVTFGCFAGTDAGLNLCLDAGTGGHAFAVASPTAQSFPNVISLRSDLSGALTDERFGFFRANFSSPVDRVMIDAKPVLPPEHLGGTSNHPFLQAFDSMGLFLATAEYSGDVTLEEYHTLQITRPTNDIKFVAFSSFHSVGFAVFGEFDNLGFSSDPAGTFRKLALDLGAPSPPVPVPEPATLFLLGSGGAVLGWRRMRRLFYATPD